MALFIVGPTRVDRIPDDAVPGPRLTGPVVHRVRCDACCRPMSVRWPVRSIRIRMCARHHYLMRMHLVRLERMGSAHWWMENPGWYRRAHDRAARRNSMAED